MWRRRENKNPDQVAGVCCSSCDACLVAGAPVAALTASAIARTFLTRLGFVDRQGAALEVGAVELSDGLIRPFTHLHEPKPPRATRFPVVNDLGTDDAAVLAEHLDEV